MHVMRINSSIEVVYIWTNAGSLSDTLPGGYPWLSLVIYDSVNVELHPRGTAPIF
jgi:hypothetical protein